MSVYLITCRELGAVKIGRSHDPHKRLKQIKTGCPYAVELEAVLPRAVAEKRMHSRFEDGRLSGEWFRITPEIESLIAANPAPSPPPKPPEQFSPYAQARIAGAAADLERKIAAIRRAEAAGKIPMWVRPSLDGVA